MITWRHPSPPTPRPPASTHDPTPHPPTRPPTLPPITPPALDWPTNTSEPNADAPAEAIVVKTLRPTDPPQPTAATPTNTPVPLIVPTMPPSPTPDCLPGALPAPGAPAYPEPAYPPPGCVTTTPRPLATYTPAPTNSPVPLVVKTLRPTDTPAPERTAAPPTATPVPQVLPCAAEASAGACLGGKPQPGHIDARFDEACIIEHEGRPMLRYRLRLESRADFTLQGQAYPRARGSWNASAALGGLSCATHWRLEPGEVLSLVGLVPLSSRPPAGSSAVIEVRSRTWSCDPRQARFVTWDWAATSCGAP